MGRSPIMSQGAGNWDASPQNAVRVGLHVAALASFAVSQPLFELLARHIEFLVAHQVDAVEIAWIALGVGWGLPGGLGLGALLAMKLAGRGSRAVNAGLIAGLIAAIALPAFENFGDGVLLEFGAAAVVGIACAAAYLHLAVVRTFATCLLGALLLFPAMFVWSVSEIAGEGDRRWPSIAASQIRNDAPVVVVVFDALPLSSLLGGDGSIDAARHPHFAALAARSHWFDNATTVAERTTYALPAILTGRYPDQNRVATAEEYPQNLFTVFSQNRSLNVIEPFTRLCPRTLCERVGSRGERLDSIASDLAVLYLTRLLPDGASESLPDVTTSWKNFATQTPSHGVHHRRGDSSWVFDRFIERINEPGALPGSAAPLHFIHINLPHRPYRYLPSGTEYGPIGSFGVAHGAKKGVWQDDEWEVAQALQRHLLQLQYADTLLGRLLQKLERVGLFDESLIVVTADHGISFRAGMGMRQVDRVEPLRNAGDILRVPLFVKLPGQTVGVRSGRNVQTIDILPTIVDVLGGRLPKSVDGTSALGKAPSRTDKVVYVRDGATRKALRVAAELPLGEPVLRRLGISEGAGLFALGPRPELHGRSADSLVSLERAGVEVRVIDAAAYQDVDLESAFIPAHVTGEVLFAGESEPLELALAINGVIRATTRTYALEVDRARFTAMVAPDSFRAGANGVEIFVVRDTDGLVALEPTRRRADVRYFGIPTVDGRIGAIGSSQGRIYPLVPGSVDGQVVHSGAYFEGEAIDARRDRPAQSLLVFAGGELLHVQPLALAAKGVPMQGTEEASGAEDGVENGFDADVVRVVERAVAPKYRRFHFAIPYGKLGGDTSAHVQFVGLARDAASRIDYHKTAQPPMGSRTLEPAWLGPTGTVELVKRGARGGLAIGPSWVPIDQDADLGGFEISRPAASGGRETLSGWVSGQQPPPAAVLVFAAGRFVRTIPVDPESLRFELELPGRDPTEVRFIVSSADGTAVELAQSPSR